MSLLDFFLVVVIDGWEESFVAETTTESLMNRCVGTVSVKVILRSGATLIQVKDGSRVVSRLEEDCHCIDLDVEKLTKEKVVSIIEVNDSSRPPNSLIQSLKTLRRSNCQETSKEPIRKEEHSPNTLDVKILTLLIFEYRSFVQE